MAAILRKRGGSGVADPPWVEAATAAAANSSRSADRKVQQRDLGEIDLDASGLADDVGEDVERDDTGDLDDLAIREARRGIDWVAGVCGDGANDDSCRNRNK
jgi:hypothetical protein